MGALHAGHASLVDAATRADDVVVMTIFVNPRQFDDPGDLSAYPSTPEEDDEVARRHGVGALVRPRLEEMWPSYPRPTATTVRVSGLSEFFEGADRPGHFDGVASVVAKILTITGPCRLYMGEKDFQQVAVVRQFVRDLGFDVEVRSCPTVRDADGLALSSRNQRLSSEGRARALEVSRTLRELSEGLWTLRAVRAHLQTRFSGAALDVAYAEVVDPETLERWSSARAGRARVLVAVRVDGVRLIDNGPVIIEEEG
jgi:pantoate--beta-alanine ligase